MKKPKDDYRPDVSGVREDLYRIIFEAETKAGKVFDIFLIVMIILSIAVTMLESVEYYHNNYLFEFFILEFFFTLVFTVEYILRIYCVRKRLRYMISFFGIIDLLSILPFFISLLLPGLQGLTVIRGLRVLRIFRILKLTHYSRASTELIIAIRASMPKILVFIMTVITSVFIIGAVMYLVEGAENGFTSIPKGIYWAIVTMTTVGYGDLVPKTDLGQFIAVILMILGYGVLAVPTGIVSSEIYKAHSNELLTRTCPSCMREGHRYDAFFCFGCGGKLIERDPDEEELQT